jgi:hypothetical protein
MDKKQKIRIRNNDSSECIFDALNLQTNEHYLSTGGSFPNKYIYMYTEWLPKQSCTHV